jgi:hypothetical protein
MSWFETALRIGSTIGNICGVLQGGSSSVAHFGRAGTINSALGGAVFFNDPSCPNQVSVMNQDANGPIAITIPGNPLVNNGPTQIVLPYSSKIPLGAAFSQASAGGDEHLEISFQAPQSNSKTGGSSGTTINTSSTQVLNPGASISIGSSFSASLNNQTITIIGVGSIVLLGIVLLDIRGATGNLVRLIQAYRGAGGAELDVPGAFSFDIPQGINFPIQYTEITALVGTSSMSRDVLVKTLDEHDIALLKALKAT